MNDVSNWAEFGLAGMTIGALFMLVLWFLKSLDKKDDFIQKILDQDKDERREERHQHSSLTNKLSDAINDLTKEIARKNN